MGIISTLIEIAVIFWILVFVLWILPNNGICTVWCRESDDSSS